MAVQFLVRLEAAFRARPGAPEGLQVQGELPDGLLRGVDLLEVEGLAALGHLREGGDPGLDHPVGLEDRPLQFGEVQAEDGRPGGHPIPRSGQHLRDHAPPGRSQVADAAGGPEDAPAALGDLHLADEGQCDRREGEGAQPRRQDPSPRRADGQDALAIALPQVGLHRLTAVLAGIGRSVMGVRRRSAGAACAD